MKRGRIQKRPLSFGFMVLLIILEKAGIQAYAMQLDPPVSRTGQAYHRWNDKRFILLGIKSYKTYVKCGFIFVLTGCR